MKVKYGVEMNWGRVSHICVSKLSIIGSDYESDRRQAIIRTNDGTLSIGPIETTLMKY